ncbi:Uridine kinase [Dimargaris cristalligena]|uniref:Uridine kinase n=1 Tax=Dimargaris cristalligena TaxID=215637 RepID=A0A4P9ZXS6_9FUNG|nr:Uridine kinase [Dimargaris cristalligena]RKP37841.1 uridine kinase [Dimargaris cristalligena]|eukprot:RKP37841.1 uridine kinase [Dimargaris cristalligena]
MGMLRKNNLLLTASGRPPWYTSKGKNLDVFIVGVAGGSASGKTSVAEVILKSLNVPWVVILSMDSFYKPLTPEQSARAFRNEHDFDHPNSFDYELLFKTLQALKQGEKVDIPIYDFKTHSRTNRTQRVYGANVVIFEGIFALYDPAVLSLMDMKIFVDADGDVRLARRLQRDVSERGRDLAGVLAQYQRFVKPSYETYIHPTMRNADVIVPRGLANQRAIHLITQMITKQLRESYLNFRWELARVPCSECALTDKPNLTVLPATNQLKGLHTIIRNRDTSRHDFIFYSERLCTLVVERGLSLLPFTDVTVTTPTGAPYAGQRLQSPRLCGVSILRAGSTMESGLRKVCKDIAVGKILIQSDPVTGEPKLHYCKFPRDLATSYVLLMDALVGTGAAALMAIRVLLDHRVPEDHIIFLNLLAAPQGIHAVTKAFPQVRIVSSMVDPHLSVDKLYIEPGLGNFGDRYFGTEPAESATGSNTPTVLA